jgi:hypothetical protein
MIANNAPKPNKKSASHRDVEKSGIWRQLGLLRSRARTEAGLAQTAHHTGSPQC